MSNKPSGLDQFSKPVTDDVVRLAYLNGRPEQDAPRHPHVTKLSGGFAIDAPGDNGKPPVARLSRTPIDPARTFFIQQGVDEGGFRQTWNRWRIVRDVRGTVAAVEVIFSEHRNAKHEIISTDMVTLTGHDAYNFLKHLGDRNCEAFARTTPSRHQA